MLRPNAVCRMMCLPACLLTTDPLIKAEKDFDLVVIPHVGDGLPDYSIKRRDYFVRWLLGQDPPRDYHRMKEP